MIWGQWAKAGRSQFCAGRGRKAMKSIAQYAGKLLNHVEALYRPGERELAIELVEALGCAVTDTGFKGDGVDTFLAVHPNPEDRNPNNNIFYISQIRSNQLAVEERLRRLNEEDSEFAALLARKLSSGGPHEAVRNTAFRATIPLVARRRRRFKTYQCLANASAQGSAAPPHLSPGRCRCGGRQADSGIPLSGCDRFRLVLDGPTHRASNPILRRLPAPPISAHTIAHG